MAVRTQDKNVAFNEKWSNMQGNHQDSSAVDVLEVRKCTYRVWDNGDGDVGGDGENFLIGKSCENEMT